MTTALKRPDWLEAQRARGAARFAENGLPTQRREAWKYTGLNMLREMGFAPAETPVARPASIPAPLIAGPIDRMVFADGRLVDAEIGDLPRGVILGGLNDLLAKTPNAVEPLFGKLADIERHPMVALNAAWVEDGFVLTVPDGVTLERPIEIVFFGGGKHAFHPRHLIRIGANARATVIERYLGGGDAGFANHTAEIAVGDGATLRHFILHGETDTALAVATSTVEIGRDASYRGFALTMGGGLIRRECEARLKGSGGTCHLDGAYLVDGARHADTTNLIDHQAPHCASRQTQKGVIGDRGRAVYQGKILVRQAAQKTDGYQLSKTLLLSPHAEIDVKPELEIYADDVKCSHGATSGQIDADALFYLRARGVPAREARALLIQGFIDGALDEIDAVSVRDAFKDAAAGWLSSRGGTAS